MDMKVAMDADLSAALGELRAQAVAAGAAIPAVPKDLVTVTPGFSGATVTVSIAASADLQAWLAEVTARLKAFAEKPQ